MKREPAYIPTAKEVNDWSITSMGHDSINNWVCVNAECERLGVSATCEHCNGSGTIWPSKEIKELYDTWEETEPPVGPGYQLWENVSEGSPISPVFETAEGLANWLAYSPAYKWRENDRGTTYEQWLKFIKDEGDSVSMVMVNGVVMTGVQAHE